MDLSSESNSSSRDSAVGESLDSTEGHDEVDELLKLELEEEKRLEEENNEELMLSRKKEAMQKHEKEEEEAKLKRLLHLLEKSQFYAKFLESRVEKSLEEVVKKRTSKRLNGEIDDTEGRATKKQKLEERVSEEVQKSNAQEIVTNEEEKEDIQKKISQIEIGQNMEQPKLLEGGILRDYQMQGFTWLKLLFESGMNGILADEMGLGKTIQVIALLCHLYEKQVPGPFLVIAPLTTLSNWLLEFQSFAPKLKVVIYHGALNQRERLRSAVTTKKDILGKRCFPVVLTSYEIPVRDTFLSRIKWKYIIVDEGQRLKNYKSQLARTLRKYVTVNRLLLTGTPLQNNLTELWSLLHFLLPEIFDNLEAFQSCFHVEEIEASTGNDQLINQHDKVISVLHEILSPFLLRREKKDVLIQLPRKKEVLVYCPLTEVQMKLYSSTVDKSIANTIIKKVDIIIPDNPDGTKQKRMSKMRGNETIEEIETKNEELKHVVMVRSGEDQYSFNIKMTNIPIMLKKIVNHPYLIQKPVLPGSNIMKINEKLVTSSGKLTILDGLLRRLKPRGHKVLLFSTMTQLLDIIEEFLIMRNYKYDRLDGSNTILERKTSIKRYNSDEKVFIFLLSTRAGGLGINLTSADTVVIFDSDWNPQADLQAQDRCHRIGQTKPVIVYRLVSTGTIDERIVSRAEAKRKLERIIIQGGNFKNLFRRKDVTNLEELKKLLNEKQHSMEMRSSGRVLTNKQWEELLDRSDLMEANLDSKI
ncbi:lymphoid-specific helicase-like [Rhodnius prolixus]|uniref:lymphoid-specific helicase-like n=1 Tax=Rhodnius prolixus TaxID=13249 RepID=UPI003D188A8F